MPFALRLLAAMTLLAAAPVHAGALRLADFGGSYTVPVLSLKEEEKAVRGADRDS